jgi:cation diffusion facilitator family transporter
MKNEQTYWIFWAFVISLLLMVLKFVAYFITGANAILTDALESIINVVATSFAFYSIYFASKPKDFDHPYGHGKIEFFSEGLEGVLILLVSLYLIYDSIQKLIHPQPVFHMEIGFGILLMGVVANFILGNILIKKGSQLHSTTLAADGTHLRLDAQSGLILLASVALTGLTNWYWLDALAAIGFSVWMGLSSIKMIDHAIANLMDKLDPSILEKAVAHLGEHRMPQWIDLHNLRIQRYGADLHVDCHVTLPNYWSLKQVHDCLHDMEEVFGKIQDGHTEVFIHADPCLPECCQYCEINDCPVRAETFKKRIEWTSQNLAMNQKHFIEEVKQG